MGGLSRLFSATCKDLAKKVFCRRRFSLTQRLAGVFKLHRDELWLEVLQGSCGLGQFGLLFFIGGLKVRLLGFSGSQLLFQKNSPFSFFCTWLG